MKEIDVKGFRSKVGYVGQEPMLFSMSIAENLRLSNPNLNDDEIR
jgi:ABC-type bacteriocin/lantibiotic exporter with double-glycine peptidase domain